MGIEQRALRTGEGVELSKPKTNIKTVAFNRLVNRWVDIIGGATPIEYEEGVEKEYTNAIKDGYFPFVIVGNHTSHFDGLVVSYLIRTLTGVANEVLPPEKKLQGFKMPLSKSLDTGGQGEKLKMMYDAVKPNLARNNLYPVNTATENDIAKRGQSPNRKEFIEEISNGINKGYGLVVLPEGSVEAGRLDKNGNRKGMQAFKERSLSTYISMTKRNGQEVVFIPVAISNGWKAHDPVLKRPSVKALAAGIFAVGDLKSFAKIKVGMPIRSDDSGINELLSDGSKTGRKKAEDYFARIIADLLPQKERGVFS